MNAGAEYLIDVSGCDPSRLQEVSALSGLFESLVVEMSLKVIGVPHWHRFPGPGGITGLALLSESHLAIHTFPETGFAALNVYTCNARPAPDFLALCRRHLAAQDVQIRRIERGAAP